MDAIAAWLKCPDDYFAGLELLKPHAASPFILNILSSGPDTFNSTKLYEELEKVLSTLQAFNTKREVEKPVGLQKKEINASELMDRRAELKAQLRLLAKPSDHWRPETKQGNDNLLEIDRKGIAFEILRIGKQLDGIFAERDFYHEHGYLPSGELDADDDPVHLQKRQGTLRTYVTRYSKPGMNADKLNQYKEELKIVDAKLKNYVV